MPQKVHFLQLDDIIHSHTEDSLCPSGKKEEWSVVPRMVCTTFSYVAHGDLPAHGHHRTSYKQFSMIKAAVFNSW